MDLTDFRRKCFANREKEWPYSLRLGDAMGTWFPLDEMFSLKSRDEYTVLVVLRGIQQTQGDIVSAPLKIRVPELQIAGINRPLYGSDRLWQRLRDLAANRSRSDGAECSLEEHHVSRLLAIRLKKRSNDVFGKEQDSMEMTGLVRDERGEPVAPVETAKKSSESRKLFAAQFTPASREALRTADKEELILIDGLHGYPLMVNHPYTFLTAFDFKGGKPTTLVAPLVTITVRSTEPVSIVPTAKVPNVQLSPSEIPKQRPSLRDWVVLRRFAGKAFGDLFLTASEAKRSELKVSLVNQGKRSIIVKKWEGRQATMSRSAALTASPCRSARREKPYFKAVRPSTFAS